MQFIFTLHVNNEKNAFPYFQNFFIIFSLPVGKYRTYCCHLGGHLHHTLRFYDKVFFMCWVRRLQVSYMYVDRSYIVFSFDEK